MIEKAHETSCFSKACERARTSRQRTTIAACTPHAARRTCMNAAEALPPGDAFPAPHKADCAKLRKNNGRFADLQASHPNRFADPSTHVDASIAGVKKTVRCGC
jgi:hypothetical protein